MVQWPGGEWVAFHPKHYLQKWHINHNEDADKVAAEEGFDTWSEAFRYHFWWAPLNDLDKPTVMPWRITDLTNTVQGVRAQSVVLPGRRGGPAASLHRPRGVHHRRCGAVSPQDHRRRGGYRLHVHRVQELDAVQAERGSGRLRGLPRGGHNRFADCLRDQPEPRGSRPASGAERHPLPAGAVHRPQSRRDQQGDLPRSRRVVPGHRHAHRELLQGRVGESFQPVRSGRGEPAARRGGPDRAGFARIPSAARRRADVPGGGGHQPRPARIGVGQGVLGRRRPGGGDQGSARGAVQRARPGTGSHHHRASVRDHHRGGQLQLVAGPVRGAGARRGISG